MTATVPELRLPTPEEFAAELGARPYPTAVRGGDFDLRWLHATPGDGVWGSWGVKATPGRRGLTLMDIDAASGLEPGPVGSPSVAPRGAGSEPGLGARVWDINHKWEVWADNLTSLYEESVSRQWSATQDIDWGRLVELPPELERALCQYMTFLTMGEYLATDVLAPWLPRFNTYFHEIKLFIAAQAMDEARHTEVFRKRIFANGGGLGMTINLGNAISAMGTPSPSAPGGDLTHSPMFSTWDHVSYAIHVVFEGAILSMFRFGEFLGKTDVDKQIFRMVMQDEARHVAYGTMHLKYLLENAPDVDKQRRELNELATMAEMFFCELFFMHPATVESCSILAGDGLANADRGLEIYKGVYRKMRDEYLNRTLRAGLDRRELCMLPADLPF